MFSFHKPRVYRSTEGCCICRAKSSSSRFTDSKKYEDDSMKCFNLDKPRKGEICNACVLLVKRFKRLPVGSNRHWGHVVDARIGPGLKSMSKFKKNKDDNNSSHQVSSDNRTKVQNGKMSSSSIPEKFCKIFKKNKKKQIVRDKGCKKSKEKRDGSPAIVSWDEEQSLPATPDSFNSDCDDNHHNQQQNSGGRLRTSNHLMNSSSNLKTKCKINRRKLRKPKRISNYNDIVHFFDENDWRRLKTCCGIVYENKEFGALIIDTQNFKPCAEHFSASTTSSSSNTNSLLFKDSTNINHQNQLNINNGLIISQTSNSIINSLSSTTAAATTTAETLRKMHFIHDTKFEKPIIKEFILKDEQQISSLATTKPPFPALKKHHLFLKRQMENFPRLSDNLTATSTTTNLIKTDLENITTVNNTISTIPNTNNSAIISLKTLQRDNENENCNVIVTTASANGGTTLSGGTRTIDTGGGGGGGININNNGNYKFKTTLHQIRSDTGKIVKHSIDKINMLCVKQSDLHEVKGLVKISTTTPITAVTTDKTTIKPKFCTKLKISETLQQQQQQLHHPLHHHHQNKNIDSSNTKFSDNSSDSGFDENMLERKSTSPPGDEDNKKILIQPVQTMFLASGVQICGQQQNLILTGNDVAARMLQQRQQSQVSIHTTGTKAAQTTNVCPTKVSAIFNQTADGSLITLSGGSNLSTMTNLTPATAASLNQKIILVKAKYNNTKPSNTN